MSEPLSALEIGIRATVTSCIQYGLTMDTVDTLIKREFLSQALEAAGNNQSQTALNIGVHRNTILRYLKQYAVPHQKTWRNRRRDGQASGEGNMPKSEWKPLESAPTDGTVVRFYRGYGNPPESGFFGRFHPNSPGKLCWRLNYTNQPITFAKDQALWSEMEYPEGVPDSWHGKKNYAEV